MLKRKDLYKQACTKYGQLHQENKAIEEMAELSVALFHFRDGKITLDELRSEIADVAIMADVLKMLYGEAECEELERMKLERLRGRLSED
jgi:hypothetical protein